jgi:hypothetical protein
LGHCDLRLRELMKRKTPAPPEARHDMRNRGFPLFAHCPG